jgi:hypothetical protein
VAASSFVAAASQRWLAGSMVDATRSRWLTSLSST